MPNISMFCNRVMVLKHGATLLDSTNLSEGIDRYYSLAKQEVQTSGAGGAQVLGLELLANGEVATGDEPRVPWGASATAMLRVRVDASRARVIPSIYIHDEASAPVISIPIRDALSGSLVLPPGEHLLEIPLGTIDLNAGKYSFVVGMLDVATGTGLARVQGLRPFRVISKGVSWGKIIRPAVAQLRTLPKDTSSVPHSVVPLE
jgi:hypothetical protein